MEMELKGSFTIMVDEMKLDEMIIDKIIAVIREAGEIILNAQNSKETILDKEGFANFVTKYDKLVQIYLIEKFEKILPHAHYLAEEDGVMQSLLEGFCFIIDPIDGTTNFIHEYQHSCISVGISFNGKMVVGIVYNPYRKEIFTAEKGRGAFKNGKQIFATKEPLQNSMLAFGCARYNCDDTDQVFELAKKLYVKSRGIRNRGSSTLDLCDVACGRNGIYFELLLQPWDYAAASLIIQEAGGFITQINGNKIILDQPCSILAGGIKCLEEVREIINKSD